MTTPVTEDNLYSILQEYEKRIEKLERAIQPGTGTSLPVDLDGADQTGIVEIELAQRPSNLTNHMSVSYLHDDSAGPILHLENDEIDTSGGPEIILENPAESFGIYVADDSLAVWDYEQNAKTAQLVRSGRTSHPGRVWESSFEEWTNQSSSTTITCAQNTYLSEIWEGYLLIMETGQAADQWGYQITVHNHWLSQGNWTLIVNDLGGNTAYQASAFTMGNADFDDYQLQFTGPADTFDARISWRRLL